MTRTEPPARRTAQLIFLAITSGALAVTGVLVAVRRPGPVSPGLRPVGYLAPLFVAGAAGFVVLLRQKLAERRDARGDAWWSGNLGTAMMLWAACEAAILAGGVAYFLAGGVVGLVAAGAGLILLLVNAPPFLEPR